MYTPPVVDVDIGAASSISDCIEPESGNGLFTDIYAGIIPAEPPW